MFSLHASYIILNPKIYSFETAQIGEITIGVII